MSADLARYQMNTQVYFHRLRRVYDYYLKEYFRAFPPDAFDSPDKILWWTDVSALFQLMSDAEDQGSAGHLWAKRIIERHHHRDVFSLDEGEGPRAVKWARLISERIRTEFPTIDFIDDLPDEPISIHKIARDDDREVRLIDFPLLNRDGRRTSLGERSQNPQNFATDLSNRLHLCGRRNQGQTGRNRQSLPRNLQRTEVKRSFK